MKHSQTPIRIAIAGLGRSGWRNHALQIATLPEQYRVVAVTDADPAARAEAQAKFGCRAYETFDALLRDDEVELLTIATPSHLHLPHTLAALQAGKHVLCEKPFCNAVDEADQMIAAAQRSERLLTVFQNRRYAAEFRKVREIIASGALGRVAQIRIAIHTYGRRWDWQTLREFHGGELNNTASHFIDQALLLVGDVEADVFYFEERTLTCGDAEDHCKLVLRARGRPLVEVEVSYACALPQPRWLVIGTRGTLIGGANDLQWKVSNVDTLPPRRAERQPTPDRSYNSEEYQWTEHTWKRPADDLAEPVLFYMDLYRTLRQGAPLAVTPQSVRRQIVTLDRCRAQAGRGPVLETQRV